MTDAATLPPAQTMARLIEIHGPWATIRALLTALARARPRPSAAALPDHLRRDIGLPPASEPGRRYWELR